MDRYHVKFFLQELQRLMNEGNVSISFNPHQDYSSERIVDIRNAVSEAINLLSEQARNSDTQKYILKRLNHNEMTLLDVKSDISECRETTRKVRKVVAFMLGSGIGWLIAKIIATLI